MAVHPSRLNGLGGDEVNILLVNLLRGTTTIEILLAVLHQRVPGAVQIDLRPRLHRSVLRVGEDVTRSRCARPWSP